MFARSFSVLWILSLCLGAVFATAAGAARPEVRVPTIIDESRGEPTSVLAMLRDAVDMRFTICCAATDRAHVLSQTEVVEKIRALSEISKFAHQTAAGLTGAADDAIAQMRLAGAFALELSSIDRRLQESLFDLLAHPAVDALGWFVKSRFGAEAEAQAGSLLRRTDIRADALEALERRIAVLVTRGEASPETQRRLAALLSGDAYAGRDITSMQ